MSSSRVNIKVVFDGVAQSALSATRRLSGELKQLSAESKRASAAFAGIGKSLFITHYSLLIMLDSFTALRSVQNEESESLILSTRPNLSTTSRLN